MRSRHHAQRSDEKPNRFRRHFSANLWVFHSNKNRRYLYIEGDVAFMHCVLMEGMPEFASYRPPLNPALDAGHSALALLPHSVARDQAGHQTWFGYLRRGPRGGPELKARREALISRAAAEHAQCQFVSEQLLEQHRFLFDNWLVLSRAMTAAANYPREAEAKALTAMLTSEAWFELGKALRLPHCDPAMMLALIARELQLGQLQANLTSELIGPTTVIHRGDDGSHRRT